MSGVLRFILGDQLNRGISSLKDLEPERDRVLMVEVEDEATYVPHHKKRIAFILSAMRHFALELRREGVRVDYVTLDAVGNSRSFRGELARAIRRHRPERVVVTEPGEWRVLNDMLDWRDDLEIDVEIRPDDRFLCSRRAFADWAEGRRQLVMEAFYREMRKRTGFLIDENGEPAGKRWNFDAENRKTPGHDV
jgi:deoxyribodipyrimidine photolyase-related protein